ncbi:DNA repair metallo-beta-lactamase-domain-containing protein [Russula earlei]|uniref:DNA repair metallo-beta-lactamase-domain-containing protein n=1 Tax=Russula earlei TaxID=71964 RepID=A0ACC0UFL3_9AGAM|nr:DNA repair metallo-beta-lactamase-domain-containing protein [Russula earlei]
MAPSKRPLFDPPPPATLDDFFAKPETSLNSRSASFRVPKRVKASRLSSRTTKCVQLPRAEIIVIDSDDDVPVPSSKRRAQVHSGSSSDVQVVHSQAITQRKPEAPSSAKSQHDSITEFGVMEDIPPTFSGGLTQNFQTASSSSSADRQTDDLHPLQDIQDCSGFPSTTSASAREVEKTPIPAQAGLDDVLEIDDEWGTGDDEFVRTNEADDDGILVLTDDDGTEKDLNPVDQVAASGPIFDQSTATTPVPSGSKDCNAFSILMSSHKENNVWKESDAAEARTIGATKANGGRRKAPFFKVLQGMPIAVDAFCYGEIPGVSSYFLTHAHSDHYTNLSSKWKAGPIYCSEGTANLVIHMLSVDPKWVHPLPMDVPTLIPGSGGITVTLIEANHCPGSSLFLFEGRQTINAGDCTYESRFVGSDRVFRYLHCGDFRASPQHLLHAAVKEKRIDIVYLDTTYLNPRYLFPAQAQVISACAELAKRLSSGQGLAPDDDKSSVSTWVTFAPKPGAKSESKLPNTLVIVGTYSIGKERIVKAIAKALHTQIYCDSRKAAILRCQLDPDLHGMLTADPFSAGVHLVPLGVVTSDRLKEYIGRWKGRWTKVVAFRPTGWTYSPPAGTSTTPSIASILARPPHREFTYAHLRPARGSTPTTQLFGVPYSEHSSFFELTCFALSLDWARIIATVNVHSAASRAKISAWIARWEAERRKRPPGEVVPYRTLEYW